MYIEIACLRSRKWSKNKYYTHFAAAFAAAGNSLRFGLLRGAVRVIAGRRVPLLRRVEKAVRVGVRDGDH